MNLVLVLFPLLLKAITLVEGLVRGPGKGTEKKGMVVDILSTAIEGLSMTGLVKVADAGLITQGVGKMIDGTVDVLNGLGVMSHGG